MAGRERDRELLLPVVAGEHVAGDEDDSEPTTPVIIAGPPPPTTSARVLHLHHHPTGIEVTDPLLSFVAHGPVRFSWCIEMHELSESGT
jgi:hypothetical protein